MPKKKKLQSTAPVMTRGQLSKAAQEAQRIRNLYTAGIALSVVIVLVLGFAVVFTFLIRPNQEVANVNGTSINRDTYNKLRRWNIYQQIQQQVFQQQLSGSGVVDPTTIQTLQTQLRNAETEGTLDSQVLQALIDTEVLRQKSAQDFSINPTQDDLLQRALKDFVPQPTPPPSSITPSPEPSETPTFSVTFTPTPTGTQTPSATSTRTITPTPGSPTATATPTSTYPPVPGASATATVAFGNFMRAIQDGPIPSTGNIYCPYGCPGLSESDYMRIIIEPQARQEQVINTLSASKIVTDVEQVRVQHILTATLEGAQAIRARLDAGEDFTALVDEQSSDVASKPQIGIYDWFPREDSGYVEPFAEGAFTTPVGEYSQPVQTQFGYHIITVLNKEVRPLTQTQIDAKKQKLYDEWFNQVKLASVISPASFQAPTPTPALVEPTIPPATNSTPTVAATSGAGTPGATLPVTSTNTVTGTSGTTPAALSPTTTPTAGAASRNTPEPAATP
ncbi:MAG: peptidylprolyl isomerase [Chloroflexia bacterium]